MGVIFGGVEVGKDITIDDSENGLQSSTSRSAQGQSGVPGEDAEGVVTAVDFLREVGAKESYDIEGDVVVIGGGNVAVDVSRSAVRCGAPKVSQFSLETRDIMPASDEEIAGEEDGVLSRGWGKEILTRTDVAHHFQKMRLRVR